jgi:hypothetical protein
VRAKPVAKLGEDLEHSGHSSRSRLLTYAPLWLSVHAIEIEEVAVENNGGARAATGQSAKQAAQIARQGWRRGGVQVGIPEHEQVAR